MSSNIRKEIRDGRLYPVLMLEKTLSHRLRHALYGTTNIFIAIVLLVTFASYVLVHTGAVHGNTLELLRMLLPKMFGVMFVLVSFWATVYLLEAFFRSFYFKEREINFKIDAPTSDVDLLTFEVLRILNKAYDGDITEAFLRSKVGKRIMYRCGIGDVAVKDFLANREKVIFPTLPAIPSDKIFSLIELTALLYARDEGFNAFLFRSGIKEKEFIGSAEWVVEENEFLKKKERWWSRESLERIPGIGKEWAYGYAYILNRYGTEISGFGGDKFKIASAKDDALVEQLEVILSREREANAMIVGEEGVGKIDIIQSFARNISKGTVVPQLENKKVVLINNERLTSGVREKSELEQLVLRIFDESIKAGNIILVFDDFAGLVMSARAIGVELLSLIDGYIGSPHIQVVAISDNEKFHQFLEQDPVVVKRFEKILVQEPAHDETIKVVERVIRSLESRYSIFFTYPAVEEIVNAAENYFTDGVMPDKAVDIAIEIVPTLLERNKYFVEKEDILSLVKAKTHIPVGQISEEEKNQLLNLEKILHDRVVGQEEAIQSVSNAMRRARAGVRNMKRPIGTFLFLGSTGVGKTETAKALAEVFFGNEDLMSRLDMSEYQTKDSLKRLIGSFEDGQVGTLTTLLREKPYGVLLLDEIEKADKDILDLFLQILDEGFFSDMKGKRVNARNVIFIATSNAGSDLIWKEARSGGQTKDFKKQLIDYIINQGLFRPEFINRFDAVIVYQPLGERDLEKIAELMLQKLRKRLKQRGIDLVVNDALVRNVMKHGVDPEFGARPMNRAIQESIEQLVAERLISGEIVEGQRVEFTDADFR